jgi:hypothetical protein
MKETTVTVVCTLLGALVGWFIGHIWIGSILGFVIGLALSFGDEDLLEAILDCLSNIDFPDIDIGGD